MYKSIKNILTLLALSLSLMLVACSERVDKKGQSNDEGSAKNTTQIKTLTLARSADPRTLDPQVQFDAVSGDIIAATYDTLFQYSYLKRPYKLEPLLLAKMPEYTGEDALTVVFELKPGVTFIDDVSFTGGKGRELVADDVLYTMKRFADSNINVNSWFMLSDVIVGLDEYREKTKLMGKGQVDHKTEQVEGLKKLGKYTFSIQLIRKSPLVTYSFASTAMSIVAHEAVEHYGVAFRNHPVGTGPFRLEKYKRQQKLVLLKNPNYHMTYPTEGDIGDKEKGLLVDANKQLPFLDRIELPYIAEAQPAMLKFRQGDIDWIAFDRDNFSNMVHKDKNNEFLLNEEFGKQFDIFQEPTLSMTYLSFNLKDGLMQNKKLRLAMAYGLDRDHLIELLTNGRGIKLGTLVPLPINGSQQKIGNQMFEYDLEKAKVLLTEAGYPNGEGLPEITMTMRGTSTISKNYFEFYRANYAKMGIKLKGEFLTFSKYLKVVDDANFQMSESAWQADYPDSENFYQLLYGLNKPPGPNISSFDNADYNRLYEMSRLMVNGPERYDYFKQMSLILKEEAPVIPTFTAIGVGMTQKWVDNFKLNYMAGQSLQYLNINTIKKAEGVNGNLSN